MVRHVSTKIICGEKFRINRLNIVCPDVAYVYLIEPVVSAAYSYFLCYSPCHACVMCDCIFMCIPGFVDINNELYFNVNF